MKFSLGDRVLLKRTGEEGIITAFLSKDLIEVSMGDISFPVYADEIDHPYLKWFTDPKRQRLVKHVKEIPVEQDYARPARLSRGIYFSFLPQFAKDTTEDIIESFRIHLLNETADHLLFQYHAKTATGSTLLQLSGSLHPFADIFLHTLSLEALNAQPRLHWQVAPREKPQSAVADVVRIRPAQLIRLIAPILQDGEPSFSILLTQDAEAIPQPTSPRSHVPAAPVPDKDPAILLHTIAEPVVDLHLEALELEGDEGQSLSIQLSHLDKKLNAAYATGLDTMLIIHGIGTGTLRDAVHNQLQQSPFVKHFSNHWMAAYGWGATQVFFSDR